MIDPEFLDTRREAYERNSRLASVELLRVLNNAISRGDNGEPSEDGLKFRRLTGNSGYKLRKRGVEFDFIRDAASFAQTAMLAPHLEITQTPTLLISGRETPFKEGNVSVVTALIPLPNEVLVSRIIYYGSEPAKTEFPEIDPELSLKVVEHVSGTSTDFSVDDIQMHFGLNATERNNLAMVLSDIYVQQLSGEESQLN